MSNIFGSFPEFCRFKIRLLYVKMYIFSGGMILTVHGKHLNSVFTPVFEVTRELNLERKIFESVSVLVSYWNPYLFH